MPLIVKKIARGIFAKLNIIRLSLFSSLFKKQSIYVFDIDNTIAFTYPSFDIKYSSQMQRYSCLAIYPAMRNFALDLIQKGHRLIYLSARPWYVFPATYQWLRSNGLIRSPNDLFIVPRVEDKIPIISYLSDRFKVIYIDDLSYNHERGEIKKYTRVIETVKTMDNVTYLGFDFIQSLQGLI